MIFSRYLADTAGFSLFLSNRVSFVFSFLFILCFCGRFVCLGRYGNRFVGRFGAQAMIFLRYLADTAGFRLFLSKA
jgi:hypothetical protein